MASLSSNLEPLSPKSHASLRSTSSRNKEERRGIGHTSNKSISTAIIDRKLVHEQQENSMPLIQLLWESLVSGSPSEIDKKKLTVDEMAVLGEALCGHTPTTEACILQIHRCRATLAVSAINNLFVEKFAGSLQSLIHDKTLSRGEASSVRDYVTSRLREVIVKWINILFPAQELLSFRKKLQIRIETFYANLPIGKGSKLGKKLRSHLKRSREKFLTIDDGSKRINSDRLSLELHVLSKFFMDSKTIGNIAKMNTQHFFLTIKQFYEFASNDLIGATHVSKHLSNNPNNIVIFLTVVLRRVWLIQKRLNKIQQKSLYEIFNRRLLDLNYDFSVDVRSRQAANPDRKQKVVRDAVNERMYPKDAEWKYDDGKWVLYEKGL